jgi:hypothetical protein
MKRIFMALVLVLDLLPAVAAPAPSTEEQSAWLAASAADSKDVYRDFVRKFPDGTFASLARIRLEEAGDSTPAVVAAGSIADIAPLEGRYSQRRSIEPRAKGNCLEAPDAACLLFEVTKLIDKETDASQRVNDLSSLAQEVARAGDVAGSVKLLRQAASIARGLASARDKASNLAIAANAAALVGNMPLAGDLLNEALAAARSVNTGKADDQSMQDRGRALIDVASHMALLGKTEEARLAFAEAKGLSARLQPIYRSTFTKEIAKTQADSGLLQDAVQTLADHLNFTNGLPQYSALGVVEIMGRYSNMGDAAEFLASIGQDSAAVALARSVGPLDMRVEKLLGVRDALSEKGAHDLSELDSEIRDVAREAAKTKNAWIYAGNIGCAIARFGSPAEGASVARSLFAQSIGNPPYFNQARFVECLARNVGPENAADYLMATRLSSDPKAGFDFKRAVEEIANSYARRGDRASMNEWVAKLPEADRSSVADFALYCFEEAKRNRIKALGFARRFKEAIAEAAKLENARDSELGSIVVWAVNGNDLNSALEATKLISDDAAKLTAYANIIAIM